MQKRIAIKNHQREIQLIMRRVMSTLIIFAGLIFLLVIRLAYLQIYKNDVYATQSTQNWLDLVPVEPTRGLIYDRNGVLLADNISVSSLDVVPAQVPDLSKTLSALRKVILLTDNDLVQFQKQLKQHRRFDEIPLKLRLSEEEVARFAENQHRFPGVRIKARLMRRYPFGDRFAHVVGYVGRINAKELNEIDQTNYSASHYIGKLGIEQFYEKALHGKVGYEETENDASGKPIRTLNEIKAIPGKNLYLTIDSNLQIVAERALDGHRGAIVAIDPATGQVLAMVSEPGFDPNAFVLGISYNDYQALQASNEKPLYDRALRGLYPPASTVKPFLALEALNEGSITPQDSIYDAGWFQLPNSTHRFHDWQRYGHGTVNLDKAIAYSCDTYFYRLADKIGIRRINHILSQFGFGTPTGIDLDHELSGVVASPEWKRKIKGARWYDGDTIISVIGQGYMQATPLQLANATAILANHGKRFVPYLLQGEQLPGAHYNEQKPIALDPIVLNDETHWDTVIRAMQNVVDLPQGTGYRFGQHRKYTVASKTGTAQITVRRRNPNEEDNQEALPEKLRDHHWFITFAPVLQPKIALVIMTENSNNAVKAARIILDYYLEAEQNVNRLSQKTEKTAS
ncbi:MAG: penicillin-binding protein 2 [Gammaproteobacteria bacterium RIFCSPHIGHO2_12_FULL_43_28]|nr:MAG: penicillin-binding protein 2 [Gammaproteobacteria bacterium RIFCSPHIGHO2_12_FULL_43_28]